MPQCSNCGKVYPDGYILIPDPLENDVICKECYEKRVKEREKQDSDQSKSRN